MHNDPALGGYTGWSFWASGNYKSQVAASMTTRHLGATYMEYSVFTSDWDEQHGFLPSGSNYMETSLKSSLCSVQDLGAIGNMDIREKYLQILSFEQIRLTRCLQQSWSGVTNNYDPASVTVMTRNYQYLQAGNFGYDKPACFTSSSRLKVRWVFQDQYF